MFRQVCVALEGLTHRLTDYTRRHFCAIAISSDLLRAENDSIDRDRVHCSDWVEQTAMECDLHCQILTQHEFLFST